ncbi:MAG: hypothetical protein JW986_09420 [Methanotrichaceae archaeon]|nr:hypothetical protein [Methanotrichaceae archaeon]
MRGTFWTIIVLSALIGLGSSSEQAGPAISSQPSFEELATRLLEPSYSGSSELVDVEIILEGLPADLPLDPPIPVGARIVGSAVRDGETIEIVLDTRMAPSEAIEFYRERMTSANWTETEIPGTSRGFAPSAATATFCQGRKNPSLTIIAHPVEGGTDLRLNVNSDPQYSPCRQATELEDWLEPIPKLTSPAGAKHIRESFTSSGGSSVGISATLETEMNGSALSIHYGDLLKAADWTLQDSGESGPSAWSTWTFEDDDGLFWNGFLFALDLPGSANERFVMMQASLSGWEE